MSGFAWMVASGEYSDYSIWCVFECEEDADNYARHVNATALLRKHRDNVKTDYTPPNAQYKCIDPIETCPRCACDWQQIVEHGSPWECYVERIEFHPSGEKPYRTYRYVEQALEKARSYYAN